VDSGFLSWVVYHFLGDRMVSMTIQSPADPPEMLHDSKNFAHSVGFRQEILQLNLLENPGFRSNPPDRCYHCKKQILTTVWNFARKNGFSVVFDGQNVDDLGDYRPGRKAVLETGTISPLLEAGFTKADIRLFSRENSLDIWDMPSTPCLATRIPYGQEITAEALQRISQAETFLHGQGFRIVRVRSCGSEVRIEIPVEQFNQLLSIRKELIDEFRRLGYTRVALDIQGFRSGSMNEGIIQ
jgi:uncharacterized protein